ncbi:dipeptide/oligopeptide/nickel ABC transporter ATP-binding protein [Muricoccus radiodurans]|uniref:ABC transporter ATP-binding protein n=1 Tax=Muricoccus radiodurans TaxID=2231721 RepID=UPI003CF28914
MSGGPVLAAEGLSAVHATAAGPLRALDGVSLSLRGGERLGVIGRSGGGKSTLARLLCGLSPPGAAVTGTLRWPGGAAPVAAARRAGLGHHVAWLPQEAQAALHPMLRIGSQVAETLRAARLPGGKAEVSARLAGAGLDPALASRYPHQLSGGQAQRAALACALAQDPAVLVVDEPTSALDTATAASVVAALDRLTRRAGVALVLVTHDLSGAAALCDRLLVLDEGRIAEEGPAARILRQPSSAVARGLSEAAGLPRLLPEALIAEAPAC